MAVKIKKIDLKFLFYAALIICTASFHSCKSPAKISESGPPPQRSKKEVLEALQLRNLDFKWLALKADIDFDSPEMGGSGTLNLRIKKDSIIWMQGKKFSIEGMRAIINKDSFYLINRLEKYYQRESINDISSLFGVDFGFEDLQQILAGNIFLPDDEAMCEFNQLKGECTIKGQSQGYSIVYGLDARDLKLKNVKLNDHSGRLVEITFDNYKKHKKHFIPFKRNYLFSSLTEGSYVMDINLNEVEIDIEKSVIFSIPLHYERLRF